MDETPSTDDFREEHKRRQRTIMDRILSNYDPNPREDEPRYLLSDKKPQEHG